MARLARWLDGEPLDGDDQARSFERALVAIVAVEYLCRALRAGAPGAELWLATAGIGAAAIAAVFGERRRSALVALAAIHAAVMVHEFPASGNHAYLELIFLLLLAFVDLGNPEERRLLLRAGRWVAVVVLVVSGIQKALLGYYDAGEFLSYTVSTETYRAVLEPLVSADESARLAALDGRPGAGPYRTSSPLLLAASWTVVGLEIALGPLLVIRRTRPLALVAAVLLLIAIESAAREFFFGLVMVNALLLFGPPTVHRNFVPVAGVVLLALTLVRLGWLPGLVFN